MIYVEIRSVVIAGRNQIYSFTVKKSQLNMKILKMRTHHKIDTNFGCLQLKRVGKPYIEGCVNLDLEMISYTQGVRLMLYI